MVDVLVFILIPRPISGALFLAEAAFIAYIVVMLLTSCVNSEGTEPASSDDGEVVENTYDYSEDIDGNDYASHQMGLNSSLGCAS